MSTEINKQLFLLAERAGVKTIYTQNVVSIFKHCTNKADLENSIRELRRTQPGWFYPAKRWAA